MPRYREVSNITPYHNAAYKGEGIKIAIWDSRNGCDYHPEVVEEVIRIIAPNATCKTWVFSGVENDLAEIKAWQPDIINASMIGINLDYYSKYANIFDEVYFVAASGNSGEQEYNYPSSHDKCLSVGACGYDPSTKVVSRVGYSTYNNKLDIVNFTGVETPTYGKFGGTSCSAPYTTGMIALYMQMFKTVNGRKPTIKEVNDYVFTHCIDAESIGKDDLTGYGLFALGNPEIAKKEVIRMQIGNPAYSVNGVKQRFTGTNNVDTPPFEKDGRTYIPLRGVLENLGYTVEWVSATKEIVIKK
jgi:hypothetical protein